MNQLAAEMGMGNTHFVTPDGYHDAKHVVTFQAMMIIAKCALENETIRTICEKTQYTIQYTGASGRVWTRTLTNSNLLLHPTLQNADDQTVSNPYYIEAAVGLKTGTTNAAGRCLIAAFEYEGSYVIIGIFGCPTDESRYVDTIALWNYYLALRNA